MWSAWFGGYAPPSDYATAEMPDWVNVTACMLVAAFILPFVAFLIVMPGVREKRVVTLVVFSLVVLTGASLSVSLYYPSWTVGRERVVVPLRAHTTERVLADLGVNVGLTNLNVSLKLEDLIYGDDLFESDFHKLHYNEKFDISSVSSMNEALKSAYCRGLPYPMLSVLEYFSLNQDAFDWGRAYRQAGHYTHAAVWLSLSCWIIAVLALLVLPHYFCKCLLGSGVSAVISIVLYVFMSPSHLSISFVGSGGRRKELDMSYGWCFWLILAIGIVSICVGLTLLLLQYFSVYTLSTFLDSSLDEAVSRKPRPPVVPEIGLSSSLQALSLSLPPPTILQLMRQVKRSPVEEEKHSAVASSSGFEGSGSLRSSLDSLSDIRRSRSSFHGDGRVPLQLQVESLSPGETC